MTVSSISFLTVMLFFPGDPFIGVRGVASRFCLFGGGMASSRSRRDDEVEDRVLRRAALAARTILEVSWDNFDVRILDLNVVF